MESWRAEHTGEVLCVACSQADQILSCAEDGVVLWSADGQLIQRLAGSFPREVTSVCFGTDTHFYCASGRCLFAYDTRHLESPLWQLPLRGHEEDELNCVCAHERDTFVAVCDDAGEIRVAETRTGKLFKTIGRQHENVCSAVQFRPKKSWELASCALDCKLIRWDFSRGRPLQKIELNDLAASGLLDKSSAVRSVASEKAQVLNPPMLHQLDFHQSGDLLAAAAEDGAVRLFAGHGKDAVKLVHSCDGVHPSSVCQAQFSHFAPDQLLLSAGNDRQLVSWNVEKVIRNSLAQGTGRSKAKSSSSVQRKGKADAAAELTTSVKPSLSSDSNSGCGSSASAVAGAADTSVGQPSHEVVAVHPTKVNWLTSCHRTRCVVIADQTNTVKTYVIRD